MQLFISLLFFLVITSAHADMIEKSKPYVTLIKNLYVEYWKDAPNKHILFGQIEQESSWNPKARLHTSREDGYGLGQVTVTPRFNNFLTAKGYAPLKKWNWKLDPYNVNNQLTFAVLQNRSNFNQVQRLFKNDDERTKGMLVSYNAGLGRVLKRRQIAIAKRYTADSWTNGLEDVHDNFEKTKLYGRPLYIVVNEYPKIIFKKAEKYRELLI